jgi:hypothetical protein
VKRQIIVRVYTDGRTTIEAKGFTGRKCLDATKFLEDGLAAPPFGVVARSYRGAILVPNPQKLGGGP